MRDLATTGAGLPASTVALMAESIAPETRRAYTHALDRLTERLGCEPSELTDAELAEYMTSMFDEGLAPSSIALAASAVRFQAKLTGEGSPIGPITARTLAGIARSGHGRGHGQAMALTWEDSAHVAAKVAGDGLSGARDAALFSLASDALLRRGEIAAVNREDLTIDGSEALLVIRRSKTDQTGRGSTMYLGRPTARYLTKWIEAARIWEGPVFRPVYRHTVVERRLSDKQVARIISGRAAECGFAGARGHSLRVGGAVSLAAAGASLVEMQQAGRWQSPAMPGQYARGEMAKRGPVARYRYGEGE